MTRILAFFLFISIFKTNIQINAAKEELNKQVNEN